MNQGQDQQGQKQGQEDRCQGSGPGQGGAVNPENPKPTDPEAKPGTTPAGRRAYSGQGPQRRPEPAHRSLNAPRGRPD